MTDRAYTLLRGGIIDLGFLPGSKLRIEHLSDVFDVSPTPVREALNRLSAEGLVTQEPYRGFRVSDLLNHSELRQLLLAREVIEVAAVQRIIVSENSFELAELRSLTELMGVLASESELDIKAFNAADAKFHRLTVAAAGNRFLVLALDALHAHAQIARHYQGKSAEEARVSNDEHRQMLSSIERGDSAAACTQVSAHIGRVISGLTQEVAVTEHERVK